MKIIVVMILGIILYCLGSALYYMVGRRGDARKMARSLTWRIGLSFALFFFLITSFYMGWIEPHPLEVGQVKRLSAE